MRTSAECSGEFEGHLTIAAPLAGDPERLREWAALRGLKCVHIVLDRGAHVSQPMLTWWGVGRLDDQLHTGLCYREALRAASFEVLRLKIEAAPTNLGVPQAEVDLSWADPSHYFEHHVKFATELGADHSALREAAGNLGARLSRNAFRAHSDGREERFVTQRCYRVARDSASLRLEQLARAISSQGFTVLEVEQEYVVWDSEVDLDAGWIDRG